MSACLAAHGNSFLLWPALQAAGAQSGLQGARATEAEACLVERWGPGGARVVCTRGGPSELVSVGGPSVLGWHCLAGAQRSAVPCSTWQWY